MIWFVFASVYLGGAGGCALHLYEYLNIPWRAALPTSVVVWPFMYARAVWG
jgi:hypothetical protein